MEKFCITCGMPLTNNEDIGAEVDEGSVCKHCVNEEGNVKSCEEIFEGGVQFFINTVSGVDRNFAESITRKNMNSLSFWKKNSGECLKGEEVSDEEFQEVLRKLS